MQCWCLLAEREPCTYMSSADTSDHKSLWLCFKAPIAWYVPEPPSITDTAWLINLNTWKKDGKEQPTLSFMRSGAFVLCTSCVCAWVRVGVCVCVCAYRSHLSFWCHLLHRLVCDSATLKEQACGILALKKMKVMLGKKTKSKKHRKM